MHPTRCFAGASQYEGRMMLQYLALGPADWLLGFWIMQAQAHILLKFKFLIEDNYHKISIA